MIWTLRILTCDNEHGLGDVSFPALEDLDREDFQRGSPNAAKLRKMAKEKGWGRVGRCDYCPDCMELEKEAEPDKPATLFE